MAVTRSAGRCPDVEGQARHHQDAAHTVVAILPTALVPDASVRVG
jgi:hypothetical protein